MNNQPVTKIDPELQELAPVDPMVSMIERIALDPDADLEKLERMLQMKERMESERDRRAFSEAMSKCQSEMEPVARNKRNDQTNSNYSDLSAIYKICKPVAGRHGFSFSVFPEKSQSQGFLAFRWSLRHSSGYEETGHADLPIDDKGIKGSVNKTGIHAFGSTASYARRYLFCMVFDIATTDDDDGNGASGVAAISAEQFEVLRDLIDRTGTDENKFKLAYGAKDPEAVLLEEFPADKFEAAKAQLERKLANV